jgi:hypothetical protein
MSKDAKRVMATTDIHEPKSRLGAMFLQQCRKSFDTFQKTFMVSCVMQPKTSYRGAMKRRLRRCQRDRAKIDLM